MELGYSQEQLREFERTLSYMDTQLLVKDGKCPHCGGHISIPIVATKSETVIIDIFISILKETILDTPEAAEGIVTKFRAKLFDRMYPHKEES